MPLIETRRWLSSLHLPLSLLLLAAPAGAQCFEWSQAFAANAPDSVVWTLASHDDGSGPAIYAGGVFTSVAGIPGTEHVARWDGTAWSALGTGINGPVGAIATYDDGTGEALYAGGTFSHAGGVPASSLARWDGTSWSAVGASPNGVRALAVFDAGSGSELYAAVSSSGGLYRWDGASWSLVGGIHSVTTMKVFEGSLYLGGGFLHADNLLVRRVARFDGAQYHAVDEGVDSIVFALEVFDDGSGPALYAAGDFAFVGSGGVPA